MGGHSNNEGVALQVGMEVERIYLEFLKKAVLDGGHYTCGAADETVYVDVKGVVGIEKGVFGSGTPVGCALTRQELGFLEHQDIVVCEQTKLTREFPFVVSIVGERGGVVRDDGRTRDGKRVGEPRV